MNNKTSDKNVGGIEEDIKILQEKDCMWHYPEKRIEKAIENIIADYERQKEINEEHQKINGELKKAINTAEKEKGEWIEECQQKDERIQELEDKLQDINTYILINGIDKPLRTATQIQAENQHEYIIQQKINKLEKERDHWHGCFIVAMENGISKEKVINVIQEYKDKIERYDEYRIQGKETDVEYYENIANTIIVQILQELLEGEK